MESTASHPRLSRQRLASRPQCKSARSRCRPLQNHKRSLHRNQQYSIYALTDGSGNISERYAYTAYGELTITDSSGTLRTASAVDNRYTYTGREWDGTLALYHYRARAYDALSGRFVSRDPIGYPGSEWNLYEIGNGNGVMALDPTGLCVLDCKGRGGVEYSVVATLIDEIVDSEIDEFFKRWKGPQDRSDKDVPEIDRRTVAKQKPSNTVYFVYHKKQYNVVCCKEKNGSMVYENATEKPYAKRSNEYSNSQFTVSTPWILNSQNKDAYVAFVLPVPYWDNNGVGETGECLKAASMGALGRGEIKPDSDIQGGEK